MKKTPFEKYPSKHQLICIPLCKKVSFFFIIDFSTKIFRGTYYKENNFNIIWLLKV